MSRTLRTALTGAMMAPFGTAYVPFARRAVVALRVRAPLLYSTPLLATAGVCIALWWQWPWLGPLLTLVVVGYSELLACMTPKELQISGGSLLLAWYVGFTMRTTVNWPLLLVCVLPVASWEGILANALWRRRPPDDRVAAFPVASRPLPAPGTSPTPPPAPATGVCAPLGVPAATADRAARFTPKCEKCNVTFREPPRLWQCPACASHVWQPSSAGKRCVRCDKEFGLLVRRHHCRACGYVACADCLARASGDEKLQVCRRCYDSTR